MNVSAFVFDEWPGPLVDYAEIPPGIRLQEELLRRFRMSLRFPAKCEENWDAFNDCIRDLSWQPDGIVVIEHTDLPLAGDIHAVQTYLDILWNAVAKWLDHGDRSLVIVFPSELRIKVMSMVTNVGTRSHYVRPYPESLIRDYRAKLIIPWQHPLD